MFTGGEVDTALGLLSVVGSSSTFSSSSSVVGLSPSSLVFDFTASFGFAAPSTVLLRSSIAL
ncbi:hypothetical protein A2U01_0111442, partial [Trifolium medium]|nr:hypothetical protein [Trifolium medium]